MTKNPLAEYPGLFFAKFINSYDLYHAFERCTQTSSVAMRSNVSLLLYQYGPVRHRQHLGNFFRYAPNRLLENTNLGMRGISIRSDQHLLSHFDVTRHIYRVRNSGILNLTDRCQCLGGGWWLWLLRDVDDALAIAYTDVAPFDF